MLTLFQIPLIGEEIGEIDPDCSVFPSWLKQQNIPLFKEHRRGYDDLMTLIHYDPSVGSEPEISDNCTSQHQRLRMLLKLGLN